MEGKHLPACKIWILANLCAHISLMYVCIHLFVCIPIVDVQCE